MFKPTIIEAAVDLYCRGIGHLYHKGLHFGADDFVEVKHLPVRDVRPIARLQE